MPANNPITVIKLTPRQRRAPIFGALTLLYRGGCGRVTDRALTTRYLKALLLTGLLFSGPANATDAQWQTPASIGQAAENFLMDKIGPSASHTKVIAGTLDPRHRLSACTQPLEGFMRRGNDIRARTIVGVRCSGAVPWKVYLPVDVVVTKPVLVSKRTLPRGAELSPNDVTIEQRDVTRLLSGYLSDPKELLGQTLKIQLLAGKMLTPAMLIAEKTIERGQSVTLSIGQGDFSIHTTGVALADGAMNQRIRVENAHSGRIVEGIVRSRQLVEVLVDTPTHFFNPKPKDSSTDADIRLSNNDR